MLKTNTPMPDEPPTPLRGFLHRVGPGDRQKVKLVRLSQVSIAIFLFELPSKFEK